MRPVAAVARVAEVQHVPVALPAAEAQPAAVVRLVLAARLPAPEAPPAAAVQHDLVVQLAPVELGAVAVRHVGVVQCVPAQKRVAVEQHVFLRRRALSRFGPLLWCSTIRHWKRVSADAATAAQERHAIMAQSSAHRSAPPGLASVFGTFAATCVSCADWPRGNCVLRVSAIRLGIRRSVGLCGLVVMRLDAGRRRVLTAIGNLLRGRGSVLNPARAAVIRNAIAAGDCVSLHTCRVCVKWSMNDALVHAHHRSVVGKLVAAPFSA